jgi:hypothetical protein
MPKFVTHIRLLNADHKDYQVLQQEMKKELLGLVKANVSQAVLKRLKRVEYALEGDISLSDATDATWRAARRTGKKYAFTIIGQQPGYELHRLNEEDPFK